MSSTREDMGRQIERTWENAFIRVHGWKAKAGLIHSNQKEQVLVDPTRLISKECKEKVLGGRRLLMRRAVGEFIPEVYICLSLQAVAWCLCLCEGHLVDVYPKNNGCIWRQQCQVVEVAELWRNFKPPPGSTSLALLSELWILGNWWIHFSGLS